MTTRTRDAGEEGIALYQSAMVAPLV